MPNPALAFGALLGGAVVMSYGVKSTRSAFTSNTGTSAAPATVSVTGPPGKTYGLISQAMLEAIGKKHHWSQAQINDWWNVIRAESNGTLTDTNSSSGAYGIAQFINGPSEYYQYGGNPHTVMGQLTAMANYISQRYGDPSRAWSFHLAHNWY